MRIKKNCEHFLAIVCNSCDWSKCFNTKIHPLKVEFTYIFFRKQPFCRFMHSLRKNENIPMRGKRIAPQQKKLLPFLPGSLLKKSTACEQALHLWRPKQVARERARELLSRDFSRLPQRIAYLPAEKLESTQKRTFFFSEVYGKRIHLICLVNK